MRSTFLYFISAFIPEILNHFGLSNSISDILNPRHWNDSTNRFWLFYDYSKRFQGVRPDSKMFQKMSLAACLFSMLSPFYKADELFLFDNMRYCRIV